MDSNLINNVINCDCLTVTKQLPDKSFSHVLTDIPYDVVSRESAGIRVFDKSKADELVFNLDVFSREMARLTKENILIFCSSEQVSELYTVFNSLGYKVFLGIWEKTNPSPVNGQHFWLSGVECCIVASHLEIKPENLIWRFPSGRSKEHPTEKPLKLMEFLVEKFTERDDLIFDPCAGSGSHLLAAKNRKRHYFGTELFNDYFQLIKSKGL